MLDFIGMTLTAALMTEDVISLMTFMDIRRGAKLVVEGIFGLWIGFAAAAAASGWIATSRPFPVIGICVATPLVAAALVSAWPAGRAALLSLPTKLLIGLNIGRVLAALFLLIAIQGRLAGPFPHFAGWGDIVTGVVAVPSLFFAVETNLTAIAVWNYFGGADLVNAIFLGVTSVEGVAAVLFSTRLIGHAVFAVVIRAHSLGAVLSDRACHRRGAIAPPEDLMAEQDRLGAS
jgi:hypothetical protein